MQLTDDLHEEGECSSKFDLTGVIGRRFLRPSLFLFSPYLRIDMCHVCRYVIGNTIALHSKCKECCESKGIFAVKIDKENLIDAKYS